MIRADRTIEPFAVVTADGLLGIGDFAGDDYRRKIAAELIGNAPVLAQQSPVRGAQSAVAVLQQNLGIVLAGHGASRD